MKENIKKLIEQHKAGAKTDDASKALDSLWNECEKIIEDTGQKQEYWKQNNKLIAEKANEIISIRSARKCMLWLSAVLSIFVILAFYIVLFFVLFCPISTQHIINMPDAAKVAFISVSFISSFGLIAIILRGLLKTNDNEDPSGVMPESIKMLASLLREEVIK